MKQAEMSNEEKAKQADIDADTLHKLQVAAGRFAMDCLIRQWEEESKEAKEWEDMK